MGPKLDELPGITLSMLDSFIDASQRDDASVETTQLLVLIKQYIIQKLSEKLPADMKALQGIVDADRYVIFHATQCTRCIDTYKKLQRMFSMQN